MSTHTPGPWVIDKEALNGVAFDQPVIGIREVEGYALAVVWADFQADECEANARLIAAAPDLLQALKALTHEAEQFAKALPPYSNSEALAGARIAIAKATESQA